MSKENSELGLFPAKSRVVYNVFNYFQRQSGSIGKAMELTAAATGVSKYAVYRCRKEKQNFSSQQAKVVERRRRENEKMKEELENRTLQNLRSQEDLLELILQPTSKPTNENQLEEIVHVYPKVKVKKEPCWINH